MGRADLEHQPGAQRRNLGGRVSRTVAESDRFADAVETRAAGSLTADPPRIGILGCRAADFSDTLARRHGLRIVPTGVAMIGRLERAPASTIWTSRTRIVAPLSLRFSMSFARSAIAERLASRARRVEPEVPASAGPGAPMAPGSAAGTDRPRPRLDAPSMVLPRTPIPAEPKTDRPARDLNGGDPGVVSMAPRLDAVARRAPGSQPATAMDVERVATEVLTVIDRRLSAHRERLGRI